MLQPVNIRIEQAISLLHRSKEYVNQSRKNIDDYRRNKSNTIPLENALTNNRIALEGYYKALMALHGLNEDMIYVFLDCQYCKMREETDEQSYFSLKHINNIHRKAETDLNAKENFFISFVGMPIREEAIARKARNDGNVGSQFGKNQVKVEAVEETCNATSGLIYGELVYLTDSNLNKEEINQETKRICTEMAHKLASLQRKSFNQCEINEKILRSYEKNGYNAQAIERKRTHLEISLNDNLQLTRFRKKYSVVCLELDESDVRRWLDIFKDIYGYLAIQNRETDVGSALNAKISDLRHEILLAQGDNYSDERYVGKSVRAICIALLLFALVILFLFIVI